jgi:hypothetical protein
MACPKTMLQPVTVTTSHGGSQDKHEGIEQPWKKPFQKVTHHARACIAGQPAPAIRSHFCLTFPVNRLPCAASTAGSRTLYGSALWSRQQQHTSKGSSFSPPTPWQPHRRSLWSGALCYCTQHAFLHFSAPATTHAELHSQLVLRKVPAYVCPAMPGSGVPGKLQHQTCCILHPISDVNSRGCSMQAKTKGSAR